MVVVFDELPTTSLLGRHRTIDARRYPGFAALARDATWFRNATTVHDSTFAAVPAMLDGLPARYPQRRSRPGSLFTLLARHGYRIRASEEATAVCPRRLCGHRRAIRYYLVRRRQARFDGFVRSVRRTRRPTLWFTQALLPHVPWVYLPSGRQYIRGPFAPIRGLNSDLGARDRGLVRLAYQRHLLQVGAVDRLLGKLIVRLRRERLYHRALIVVTADHGISFRLGERDRRTLTRANVQGIAPVPLFVKAPRQRRGRVSRVYARTIDVLPTIARLLRLRVPWRTNGSSLFSRAVRRRRGVRIAGRSPKAPVIKLGARAFQARWSRAIRYQHFLFGFGDRGPGLYGVGPHRSLVGRRLGPFSAVRPGGLRAVVFGAGELRDVRLGSYFRPSLISGRILGGRRRVRRDLAIAVNGRIAATGRSFYLRGRRAESFAVMVPEGAFREGGNRVDVVSVARRRGRLLLRPLGGA